MHACCALMSCSWQWPAAEQLVEHGLGHPEVLRKLKELQSKEMKGLARKKATQRPTGAGASQGAAEEEPEHPACRLRTLIPQSRAAFLVPDPTGLLEPGQCFFQPTIGDQGVVLTAAQGQRRLFMVGCPSDFSPACQVTPEPSVVFSTLAGIHG